jgi:hypothetical protein
MRLSLFVCSFVWTLSISASEFTHKTWCTKILKLKVGGYLKPASEFVDIDPRLLAVGMSSEGFATKEEFGAATEAYKFNGSNFFVDATDTTTGEVVKIDVSNIEVAKNNGYGDTWLDDGADTFGYEYPHLKRLGLIPNEFTADDMDNIHKYELGKHPDFVFYDKGTVNEAASMRFNPSDIYTQTGKLRDYTKRYGRQENPKGDWGATSFKTPKAQMYANAAMWKHAQIKLKQMRENLIDWAHSPDFPSSEKRDLYIKQLARPMSHDELVFWTKAMYNGGQGTQAATYFMYKHYLNKGFLKNEDYLKENPSKYYGEVYTNSRRVLDSYKYAKSINCPGRYPSPSKSIFDTPTVLRKEFKKQQSSSRSIKNE